MTLPALYEVAAEYRENLARLNDLDLPAEVIADTLESIGGDYKEKCTNVGFVIRNIESLAAQIKDAEAAMATRRKSLESRAEHVREYLLRNMLACDISKIESPYFTLSIRTNPPKVVIDDPEAVPMEYWRQPPVPLPEIDRKAIAAEFKAGGSVEGCHTEQDVRLSIK
jgi:hypothetical protein